MTVRRLDPVTGDIVTSGQQFLTGIEEIAQTIETRLGLFLGEYFRDITEGTPWHQTILGKEGSLHSKEAAIRNRIVRTPGVVRITRFNADFNPDTRAYSVSVEAMTTYGELKLNKVF